jgi:hypothetical protein
MLGVDKGWQGEESVSPGPQRQGRPESRTPCREQDPGIWGPGPPMPVPLISTEPVPQITPSPCLALGGRMCGHQAGFGTDFAQGRFLALPCPLLASGPGSALECTFGPLRCLLCTSYQAGREMKAQRRETYPGLQRDSLSPTSCHLPSKSFYQKRSSQAWYHPA